METNEIVMPMDVKFDIHDKRPESLKFKVWTRCQVKVEAIKCLPCFLRITFWSDTREDTPEPETTLSLSINVPGVTVSLAASRTKQHSYGIFWIQNRRDCFIYFALDTEATCRSHMKWLKKSIKNLELHRQIFLQERRSSRDTGRVVPKQGVAKNFCSGKELQTAASAYKAFGPLPKVPDCFDGNRSSWSRRVSRASEIYEEIFEGIQGSETPRLSRRLSRSSIASGIYEEMKPTANNFNAIVEEMLEAPPPIPPLPPPRKRINTFETEVVGLLGEIPRSNTNPESEMAKKKKYKNVFDIFSTTRNQRAESVSETQASSVDELISDYATPKYRKSDDTGTMVIYSNGARPHMKHAKRSKTNEAKRNSFSSPDLSKINLLDSLDEEGVANLLFESFGVSDDFCLDHESLDESAILFGKSCDRLPTRTRMPNDYLDHFNISQRIPNNFNFSACNTSTMNLIGANGAAPLPNPKKNKILVDDLTGYCIMAPILKRPATDAKPAAETASSGYSTGSCSSYASSCAPSADNRPAQRTSQLTPQDMIPIAPTETDQRHAKSQIKDDSVIYENMLGSLNTSNIETNYSSHVHTPPSANAFSNNLYENLLTVKAAQELELQTTQVLSTSTPTESPLAHNQAEEESYYQTPRKSIISVDDKIPSYYPNNCDTIKMRRWSNSSSKGPSPTTTNNEKSSTSGKHQSSTAKERRERKENVYISSPQQIVEHRSSQSSLTCSGNISTKKSLSQKLKSKAVQKISENVYAVKHGGTKKAANNNNNQPEFTAEMKEKLQSELLQLALLKNIDFKFDDAKNPQNQLVNGVSHHIPDDAEDENKHDTENFWQRLTNTTPQRHHLQLNQASNTKSPKLLRSAGNAADGMSRSSKLENPTASAADVNMGGVKKFASLPRFKKIDFSPLKMRINNVLQRHQQQDF